MSARAPNEAGFTLVEAMVSLFVFSIIALGCVAMLMQSVDSQRRVSEAHEALRELQTARALLAGDMAQLVARDVRQADGTRRPSFVGGDAGTALSFVRAAAEADAARGAVTTLSYVEYTIEDDQIVRTSRAYLDANDVTPTVERVIFARAADAHFEFHDGIEWREQWTSIGGQAPPRAVALVATVPRYGEVRLEALVGL